MQKAFRSSPPRFHCFRSREVFRCRGVRTARNFRSEGFQKLTTEISLFPLEGSFPMPWGKDRAQLFYGELPFGDSLEPIVIRRGMTHELQTGGKIGGPTNRPYFEVCVHPKLLELARKKVGATKG